MSRSFGGDWGFGDQYFFYHPHAWSDSTIVNRTLTSKDISIFEKKILFFSFYAHKYSKTKSLTAPLERAFSESFQFALFFFQINR